MTIAIVQSGPLVAESGVSSITFTLSGVTAGNTLVVSGLFGDGDGGGGISRFPANWLVYQQITPGNGADACIAVLPGQYVTGGSVSVTVTSSDSSPQYPTGKMYELSGVDSASPVDVGAIGYASGTSSSLTIASPTALQKAGEFVLSAIAFDSGNDYNQPFTPSTGWTQDWAETDDSNDISGATAYQAFPAVATPSLTWSGFNSDSGGYASVLVPLLPSGGGGTNSASGIATVTPAATGSISAGQPATGAASVTLLATGAAIAVASVIGSASFLPGVTGTIQSLNTASGSATIQPSDAGTLSTSQSASGVARIVPDASGSLVAQGRNSISGVAVVTASASGRLSQSQAAIGAATVEVGGRGSVSAGANHAAGIASLIALASGRLVAGQTMAGLASVVPVAAGAIGSPSYAVNPAFYIKATPRTFTVGAPARSFSVSAPRRSFYVRCNPMLTKIPSTSEKGPLEVQVLTLDATAQLASGETLTGTPVLSIVTEIGSDNPASLTLDDPIINSQSITADNGVVIQPGCCVQAQMSGGQFSSQYIVSITVTTSNVPRTITLQAIVPMRNQ